MPFSSPVNALRLRAAFLICLACCPAATAAEWRAQVIRIVDGDTLTVLVDDNQVKIRLVEIDAPESKQPFGTRSRQSLSDLCFGRSALVHEVGRDRYGRTLARVECNGIDANAEQVRRGMAWVFDRYAPSDSALYDVQRKAQRERTGLWSDPAPVSPWEWRRAARFR